MWTSSLSCLKAERARTIVLLSQMVSPCPQRGLWACLAYPRRPRQSQHTPSRHTTDRHAWQHEGGGQRSSVRWICLPSAMRNHADRQLHRESGLCCSICLGSGSWCPQWGPDGRYKRHVAGRYQSSLLMHASGCSEQLWSCRIQEKVERRAGKVCVDKGRVMEAGGDYVSGDQQVSGSSPFVQLVTEEDMSVSVI